MANTRPSVFVSEKAAGVWASALGDGWFSRNDSSGTLSLCSQDSLTMHAYARREGRHVLLSGRESDRPSIKWCAKLAQGVRQRGFILPTAVLGSTRRRNADANEGVQKN